MLSNLGGFLVSAVLLLSARPVLATEPLPPPVVRDTAVGDWAGIAQDPVGQSFLYYLAVPARGSATLVEVHSSTGRDTFLRGLSDLEVLSGRVRGTAIGFEVGWLHARPDHDCGRGTSDF